MSLEEATQKLSFDRYDLLPAIIQDQDSGEVLMLAYMNRESLKKTMQTGRTWFWSRSRKKLWQKGETSGNVQVVKEILYDCDADALLIKVAQTGPACHTGERSCFYRSLLPGKKRDSLSREGELSGEGEEGEIIPWLTRIIRKRAEEMPRGSYVASLLEDGTDKVLKKLAEESAEVIIAAKNKHKGELVKEAADLLFHFLVLLEAFQVDSKEVVGELRKRRSE